VSDELMSAAESSSFERNMKTICDDFKQKVMASPKYIQARVDLIMVELTNLNRRLEKLEERFPPDDSCSIPLEESELFPDLI
jgi:hypothetical protein